MSPQTLPPPPCPAPWASASRPTDSPTSQGFAPAPHLKWLPEHQREDAGHLLLAPAAALESVGHHGGAGEPGLDVEDDVARLRQEVDLKPGGHHGVGEGGWQSPTEAEEGTREGESASLTGPLQSQNVPAPAGSSPGPGHPRGRLQTVNRRGSRGPGSRASSPWGTPSPRKPHSLWPVPRPQPLDPHAHLAGGSPGRGSIAGGAPMGPALCSPIQVSPTCKAISPASVGSSAAWGYSGWAGRGRGAPPQG